MSKGGSTTSETKIPAWLENAGIENINRARDVSQIGYTPYYGADVAAFSPMQQQSMRSTGNAASAFGLAPQGFDGTAGIPQAQTFAGNVQGYSSAPMFEQAKDNLYANAPGQYNAIADMFIDPFTGASSTRNYTPTTAQVLQSNYAQSGDVGGVVAGINNAPDFTPAADGGTGYWQGGPKTGMQTQNMSDEEFEAYVLAEGLPSDTYTTGDALRGLGGNLLDSSMIGRIYEGITGNVMSGGSPNAIVSELDNSDVSGGLLGGATTTPLESANIISGNGYYGNGDQYAASLQAVQAAQQQRLSQERADADAARSAAALQAEVEAQNYASAQQAAAVRMANEKAAQAAHAQKMAAAISTVNSGGDGRGARQRSSGGYAKSKAPNEAGSRFGL